jgi:alkaline phosphatase D
MLAEEVIAVSVKRIAGLARTVLALTLLATGCEQAADWDNDGANRPLGLQFTTLPQRIAFGSCMDENSPKPILDLVTADAPDLFLFLGDNIYGDTDDMAELRAAYDRLGASPEFQRLRAATTLLATWDDHDYGRNDAGSEYPFRVTSQEIFLQFWEEPADSPRWTRPGVYTSYEYSEHGRTLQIVLLDTRYFRGPMFALPNSDPAVPMLGDAQWLWLEQQLRRPADLRLIGTSTQFGHAWNGYESWTNLPAERDRLIDMIAATEARGVIFLSGDVHWGELSRQPVPAKYDLWDLTSSGLTEVWDRISPNENRIGDAVAENNYGIVDIDWDHRDPVVRLALVDVDGAVRLEQELRLSSLAPGAGDH